jgi:hypothetical protein
MLKIRSPQYEDATDFCTLRGREELDNSHKRITR